MLSSEFLSVLQVVIYHTNLGVFFFAANSSQQLAASRELQQRLPDRCFINLSSNRSAELLEAAGSLKSVTFIDFNYENPEISEEIQKLRTRFRNAQIHKPMIDVPNWSCNQNFTNPYVTGNTSSWFLFNLCQLNGSDPPIYRQIINRRYHVDLRLDSKLGDSCAKFGFTVLGEANKTASSSSNQIREWRVHHQSRYCSLACPSNMITHFPNTTSKLFHLCSSCVECRISSKKVSGPICFVKTTRNQTEVGRSGISIVSISWRFLYLMFLVVTSVGFFINFQLDTDERVHARAHLVTLFLIGLNNLVVWNIKSRFYNISYYIRIVLHHIIVVASMLDTPYFDRLVKVHYLNKLETFYIWSNYLLAFELSLCQIGIIQLNNLIPTQRYHIWISSYGFLFLFSQIMYTLPWWIYVYWRHIDYYNFKMKLARMLCQAFLLCNIGNELVKYDANEVVTNALSHILLHVSFFYNISNYTYELKVKRTNTLGEKEKEKK